MKPTTKKFLKIGMPILGVSMFAVLIVCVSGVLVKVPTVSIGGSTAVLPLVEAFSKEYKDIDIVTSAGGSGAGINSIIQGTKEIGMASKNPNILKDKESRNYQAWEKKQVKTLTIAWDGIGIVYKPSSKSKDLDICLNADNLAKIYASFSGIEKITFNDLLNNGDNTELIPYARNGGASISGTADGFLKDSHLDYQSSSYWTNLTSDEQKRILDILENGSYGNNVVQTAEANSQAWNRIKDAKEGSIIYLSSGFILNNRKQIESAGFKIAKYNNSELTNETITQGYNWYRPFNLIYSINQIKNKEKIVKMLQWILFDEKAKNIISDEGYVSLTEQQIQDMGYSNGDINFVADSQFSDVNLGFCGAGEKES